MGVCTGTQRRNVVGDVIPFPSKKPGRSKAELEAAAQRAVEAGLSPMHPALQNIKRNNVVPFKPKNK